MLFNIMDIIRNTLVYYFKYQSLENLAMTKKKQKIGFCNKLVSF
ncbi:hypothetical protein P800_03299 [Acinetobacter lwoffii NCTC 5866 = CIP 64.10 = NIPH 512]|uniref:Uncharacterized protein n=1 Tax=Acinetobacter lwoffii NCTC 5866 = CIP 64.10 = NIPH 512 TaxID=981327 RepID=A0ABN0PTA9_ACILW|nr:hypothetical protein P800_03299 [Acinetobacter lwoffii NCTC 5866 = CIP 64.10 = NIPH 512]